MTTTLKNLKFRVADENQSVALQETLFRLGYRWSITGTEFIHTTEPYLYAYSDSEITFGDTQWAFDSHMSVAVDTAKFIDGHKPKYSPRPHADLIIAWANGAKIQRETQTNVWRDDSNPDWLDEDVNYRIAPDEVFPKTSISSTDLYDIYATGTGNTNGEDLEQTVNYALEKFVESGELAAYVKAHGVDGKGGAQ